ncbi:hypothetical protein PGT21_022710 [Puccinia graminis f. sp. tritici]|uniref:Uncharacterized protein n=1 Tax=Puccinia graminis f. sp. tritici TaxID=56615 RepID=A0A5B0PYM7_PUCGR|nr:hypothetical protein PGT21_022710 [Puccinia graminis f. sp. tritici]
MKATCSGSIPLSILPAYLSMPHTFIDPPDKVPSGWYAETGSVPSLNLPRVGLVSNVRFCTVRF